MAENALDVLLEYSPDPLLVLDLTGNILAVNKLACKLYGYTKKTFLNINYKQLDITHSAKEIKTQLEKVLSASNHSPQATRHRKNNQSSFTVDLTFKPFKRDKQKLILVYIHDTSKQTKTIELLKQNERLLRDAETINKSGSWEFNVKSKEMFWTKGLYKLHEIPIDPAIDHVAESLKCYSPNEKEKIFHAFNQCLTKGIPYDIEIPFTTSKNKHLWIRTKTKALKKDGEIVKIIGSVTDITKQKRADLLLKESEKKFSRAFKFSPLILIISRLDNGTIVDINDQVSMLGYTKKELLNKNSIELGFWQNKKERDNYKRELQKSGQVKDLEVNFKIKSGEIRHCLLSGSIIPVYGEPHIISIIHDISEKFKIENQLIVKNKEYKGLAEKFEAFFKVIPDAVAITEPSSMKIVEANKSALNLFGYTRSEFIGKTTLGLNLFENPKDRETALTQLKENKFIKNFRINLRKKTGEMFPALISNTMFEVEGTTYSLAIVKDISEILKKHQELLESKNLFQQIAENINECFSIIDIGQDKYIYISPEFENIFGYPIKKALSYKFSKFKYIAFDDHKEIADIVQDIIEGKISRGSIEVKAIPKDEKFKCLRIQFSGIRNSEGKIYRLASVIKDITPFKESSKRQRLYQQKLMQADKMASLGELVAGIVHEINNPNNYILPNARFVYRIWRDLDDHLKSFLPDNQDINLSGLSFREDREDILKMIESIIHGAERIDKIVKNLKAYVRPTEQNLNVPIDLNKIIMSAILIMNNLLKKSTKHFDINLADLLPKVKGNEQQIEQVVINLISNACQSLGDHGEITISSVFDQPNSRALIIIKDNGEGMSKEILKNIFNPFYTTKRDKGGTGLGMSISYSIIKAHQGDLIYDSEKHKGTTVKLSLPIIK